MSTNAIFNRRVYLQVRGGLQNFIKTLDRLPATGEEIARVKAFLEAALREPIVPVDEAPVCKIHHVAMTKREGRYGAFYSCQVKSFDGSWCSYRPPKV
jgi:hypothetical protein